MATWGYYYPNQAWDIQQQQMANYISNCTCTTESISFIPSTPTKTQSEPSKFKKLSNHKFHELLDRFKDMVK